MPVVAAAAAYIAAVCFAWGRWLLQAVTTGPGKSWSATGVLAAFHISKCWNDYGVRLSVFERRVKSCFGEASANVKLWLMS